jgi:hypothetical protein
MIPCFQPEKSQLKWVTLKSHSAVTRSAFNTFRRLCLFETVDRNCMQADDIVNGKEWVRACISVSKFFEATPEFEKIKIATR